MYNTVGSDGQKKFYVLIRNQTPASSIPGEHHTARPSGQLCHDTYDTYCLHQDDKASLAHHNSPGTQETG